MKKGMSPKNIKIFSKNDENIDVFSQFLSDFQPHFNFKYTTTVEPKIQVYEHKNKSSNKDKLF